MNQVLKIYLDTTVNELLDRGIIDRNVLKSCLASKPPLKTAGDIAEHYRAAGNFIAVPGCRRGGRNTEILTYIAEHVESSEMPADLRPTNIRRRKAGKLNEEANFDFLDEKSHNDAIEFKKQHGHLPMLRIIRSYLTRPDASRNEVILADTLGFNTDYGRGMSLAEVSAHVGLSRERVRQILLAYKLPEELSLSTLWNYYVDHSTYFADATCEQYQSVVEHEIEGLPFSTYADIISRVSMLQNINGTYLARQGWTAEIGAWYRKLKRLSTQQRTIESRLSIEGMAMGGQLDTRLSVVVLNQIAPACGIRSDAPDGIILPKNT